jgi:tetratricopeptide (TPR) repeat protein
LTHPFHAIEKYIHYTAGENYKLAFQNADNPTDNIDSILNLAICFIKLGEYNLTIDTLEYVRSTVTANPVVLALLGEAYFQCRDIPKSLLLFREAFFIDPTKIELDLLSAEPIMQLKEIAIEEKSGWGDIKEWIPVFGHITDIFYVRRHLTFQTVDAITKDIYNLERTYQTMSIDRVRGTNTMPRLINKYLWLFDFYKEQSYNFENLTDIRSRLIEIDKKLFIPYFKNIKL